MTILCRECDFWNLPPWASGDNQPAACECRRHAPTMLPHPEDSGLYENALWPRTRASDSCGDGVPLTAATEVRRQQQRDAANDSKWSEFQRKC